MTSGYLLVVEDTEYLRTDLEELLELNGYAVRSASNASEGLSILQSSDEDPVCIISDLMMPGDMNGYDLLNEVRSSPRWKDIPFIVLTGRSDNIPSGTILVKKPFLSTELLNIIAKTLDEASV